MPSKWKFACLLPLSLLVVSVGAQALGTEALSREQGKKEASGSRQRALQGPEPAPLTDDELKEVWGLIPQVWDIEQAYIFTERFRDRPLHPFLIEVIEKEDVSAEQRDAAMTWLAAFGDVTGEPARSAANRVFGRIIKDYYKEDRFAESFSSADEHRLYMAILCLGYVADKESLDLLREMADKRFWSDRGGAPRVLRDGLVDTASERVADHLRLIALQGVAMSGSEDVLEMLRTGKGVPEDLRRNSGWLLRLAERRKNHTFYPKEKEEAAAAAKEAVIAD